MMNRSTGFEMQVDQLIQDAKQDQFLYLKRLEYSQISDQMDHPTFELMNQILDCIANFSYAPIIYGGYPRAVLQGMAPTDIDLQCHSLTYLRRFCSRFERIMGESFIVHKFNSNSTYFTDIEFNALVNIRYGEEMLQRFLNRKDKCFMYDYDLFGTCEDHQNYVNDLDDKEKTKAWEQRFPLISLRENYNPSEKERLEIGKITGIDRHIVRYHIFTQDLAASFRVDASFIDGWRYMYDYDVNLLVMSPKTGLLKYAPSHLYYEIFNSHWMTPSDEILPVLEHLKESKAQQILPTVASQRADKMHQRGFTLIPYVSEN